MTTFIKTRKGNKLQLNGNILSGDTYPIKDYIKSYMDGRWVSSQKAWQVDPAKVEKLLNSEGAMISRDAAPVTEPVVSPKGTMSYAHFLRSADDPNSDY